MFLEENCRCICSTLGAAPVRVLRRILCRRDHRILGAAFVCLTLLLIQFLSLLLPLRAESDATWYMVGANPQRTSWVSEEIRGYLEPVWSRPFEPYISQKVQIIANYGKLYVSTARGLYALDAETGEEEWVYPTALPLGHSPTVVGGVVYVGGFDKMLHAIDAYTGQGIWRFTAKRGFQTNPLVVNGTVYAGNRDGNMYAVDAESGELEWKVETGGAVLFSAAYADGTIFFASNDSHAYALDAGNGDLIWKSKKLPGSGFHSWWPVVYRDVVIFAGSHNYKHSAYASEGMVSLISHDLRDVYPNRRNDPKGTLVGPPGFEEGDWVEGTPTIDTSRPTITENGETTPITEYLEEKPWRRSYFVLYQETGHEVTYDFDHDGLEEYAPILWAGTHNGNRYPPVVGGDGVLYQQNNYLSDPWIAGGHISGWKLGTPFISLPYPPPELGGKGFTWNAVDEPIAHSAGGNLIYWNRCCDRVSGWFDITQPAGDSHRAWEMYFTYNIGHGTSLEEKIPRYNQKFHNPDTGIANTSPYASFGRNGVYGWHGDTNPPIPYRGRVYMHRSNAVTAFGSDSSGPVLLPTSRIYEAAKRRAGSRTIGPRNLLEEAESHDTVIAVDPQSLLEKEVKKILAAGHLRAAYIPHGAFDNTEPCGEALSDYWHSSSETIYTLIRALPHLPESFAKQVESYLRAEIEKYPPWTYRHIGWEGAQRETFDVPPDVDLAAVGQRKNEQVFRLWEHHPFALYALSKFADVFGNAEELFEASQHLLPKIPNQEVLKENPHAHNALIAGYLGYLRLEALAGFRKSVRKQRELQKLLDLRVSLFTLESPFADRGQQTSAPKYCRTLNVANNFMFLVPELADYLREHAFTRVKEALDEYERLAPYWFVSLAEEGFGENTFATLYDSHAILQARALILQESFESLLKFIDVPAVEVGDLYYIQNLVAILDTDSPKNKRRIRTRLKGDSAALPLIEQVEEILEE